MFSAMRRGFPWARLPFALAVAGASALVARALAGGDVPAWTLGVILGLLTVAIGAGVFLNGAGLFARPLLGVDPGRSGERLALTFDDGPDPVHTRRVLDLLEARGHRATFFLIGAQAERHPELAAEIAARGHA